MVRTLYLVPGWKAQSGAVGHYEGEDRLEGQGQKRVEPKDQPVAVLTDVARNLETTVKKNISENFQDFGKSMVRTQNTLPRSSVHITVCKLSNNKYCTAVKQHNIFHYNYKCCGTASFLSVLTLAQG
jgi:hypothetical protein